MLVDAWFPAEYGFVFCEAMFRAPIFGITLFHGGKLAFLQKPL